MASAHASALLRLQPSGAASPAQRSIRTRTATHKSARRHAPMASGAHGQSATRPVAAAWHNGRGQSPRRAARIRSRRCATRKSAHDENVTSWVRRNARTSHARRSSAQAAAARSGSTSSTITGNSKGATTAAPSTTRLWRGAVVSAGRSRGVSNAGVYNTSRRVAPTARAAPTSGSESAEQQGARSKKAGRQRAATNLATGPWPGKRQTEPPHPNPKCSRSSWRWGPTAHAGLPWALESPASVNNCSLLEKNLPAS